MDPILSFKDDKTLHLPCREEDYLLWFSYGGIVSNPEYTIIDYWALRNGDHVMITNRIHDIPVWFQLHPTEVCGTLTLLMMEKIKNGYNLEEIMDGPNIWRAKAGDRIVWIGQSRPGYEAIDDIIQIFDFDACALLLGETNDSSFESNMKFGANFESHDESKDVAYCRRALKIVLTMKTPRRFSPDWLIG